MSKKHKNKDRDENVINAAILQHINNKAVQPLLTMLKNKDVKPSDLFKTVYLESNDDEYIDEIQLLILKNYKLSQEEVYNHGNANTVKNFCLEHKMTTITNEIKPSNLNTPYYHLNKATFYPVKNKHGDIKSLYSQIGNKHPVAKKILDIAESFLAQKEIFYIFFDNTKDGSLGFYSHHQKIIQLDKLDDASTIIHELSHFIFDAAFNNDSNPYHEESAQKTDYQIAFYQTYANICKLVSPNSPCIAQADVLDIVKNADLATTALTDSIRIIAENLIDMLSLYEKDDYPEELVVLYPELLVTGGVIAEDVKTIMEPIHTFLSNLDLGLGLEHIIEA